VPLLDADGASKYCVLACVLSCIDVKTYLVLGTIAGVIADAEALRCERRRLCDGGGCKV
jgi:hypothetical protein